MNCSSPTGLAKYRVIMFLLCGLFSSYECKQIANRFNRRIKNEVLSRDINAFRDKAVKSWCFLVGCDYDIWCGLKGELISGPSMHYYKVVLEQFGEVLENITAYEMRVQIFKEPGLKLAYVNLMRSLKMFDDGSKDEKHIVIPDLFYPFPSNDMCVDESGDKLNYDKQVFERLKLLS